MGHLSQDQLADILTAAAEKVTVGARYRHYKNQDYIVTGLALWEATNEPVVVYCAEYGKNVAFVRPLNSWLETVEWEGSSVPRFRRTD